MAFNALINSIAPVPTPPDWVRASDWPVITDTPNEVQFLVADTGAKAFTIQTTFTRTSGNIYIDWGDGVIDTITNTASTNTNHVYSTGGTPCSRGYNTWKIRIYGDATCVITNAQHITNTSVSGGIYYTIGLLEAYFGNNTCNTNVFNTNYFLSFNTSSSLGSFQYLEYVKLPATVAWDGQLTRMFQNCTNLFVVVMPTSASSLVSLLSTFEGCTNLRDITLPSNATSLSSALNTFTNCTNLRSVTFPTNINSCSSLSGTFINCISLKNVTFPSINAVTSMLNLFSGCTSLQWVRFTSLPSPASPSTTVNLTNTFSACYNLQNVYFPSSCNSNALYNVTTTFSSCIALRNIVFPTNFNASALTSAFNNCSSITNIIFQSPMSALTTMQTAFNGCTLLNSVTLPTTVSSSGINLNATFQNCYSLASMTIPSGWLVTTFFGTFGGCTSITSITLPNNAQNSCTTMANMCVQCNKLETIVMPTSLTAVNNLSTMFNNCFELKSVTFPSTMNSVTTIDNIFNNCRSLTSVTLPTSMSVCTIASFAFSACYSLTSLTMPATISLNLTTYSGLVQQCPNLTTLTLPTTQTALCNNISNMFFGCGSLTTITNLNRVGNNGAATPLVNGQMTGLQGSYANRLTSLSFVNPFSVLSLNGENSTTNFNRLNSLRLLNAGAGQWTGSSPQINVSYCDLGVAALNQLFTDLTTITSKTINITGCTGAAGCTRSIATAKGWTVTG